MAQEGLPSWLVMLMGAAPSAGLLAWHKFWVERSDKRRETAVDGRARERATLDAHSLAIYDRLDSENRRTIARLTEVDLDRNRGWDLARWWNSLAHQMKHKFSNIAQVGNGRLERIGRIVAEIEELGGVIGEAPIEEIRHAITMRHLADIKRLARPVDIPTSRLPDLEDPIPQAGYSRRSPQTGGDPFIDVE